MTREKKYLAHVHLQTRLAPLPESVTLVKHTIHGVMGAKECDLSRLGREPIHLKFANWRSGPEDILEFTKRYGVLDWDGKLVGCQSSGTKFAFLDFEWQQRQNEIRELWEKRREGRGAEWWMLSMAGHFPLAREKDRISRQFEPYDPKWKEDDDEILEGPETIWEPTPEGPIGVVTALTTWQYICLLMMFEKLTKLRKCENPQCAAPYFVASRDDRKFCGEDCGHLIAARRWWSRHGNDWRHKKSARRKKPSTTRS